MDDFFKDMKSLDDFVHSFLENDDDNDSNFDQIIEIFQKQKFHETREKLKNILQFLLIIFNNHHRGPDFINKVNKILNYFSDPIKQTFTNIEIFKLFEECKFVYTHLLESKLITFDESIYKEVEKKVSFYWPESKSFITNEQKKNSIEKNLIKSNPNVFENFEEKRKKGENTSKLCTIIRNDSIDEFICYVNEKNLSLNSTLKMSIFETNDFLSKMKSKASLIEYATFYGAIQIFNYLKNNDAEMKESLLLFAIHSNNSEIIIDLLEYFQNNIDFDHLLIESIKCHHSDVAHYLFDNFISQKKNN